MRSNFGFRIKFFHFFPQNFVWHVATSWHHKYLNARGQRSVVSFEIHHPPIFITIDVLVIAHFQAIPPLELRLPWKKFKVLESSLKELSTLGILCSYEEVEISINFLPSFFGRAHDRKMATNNRTKRVGISIIGLY